MTARRRALLLLPLLPAPLAAQEGAASAVVEAFHATLLGVMREARALGQRGRMARLAPAMDRAFDLPAMARIAVGPAWASLAPPEQAAVSAAFAEWSVATFAHRFDGYGGERFRTLGESALRNDRLVRTELVRPNDTPVALGYLLRQGAGAGAGASGGGWRIVDVYLDGTISELASRRAEFATLLREGGAARLVAELRARTAALAR